MTVSTGMPNPRGGPPAPDPGPGDGPDGPGKVRLLRHPMVWRLVALVAFAGAVGWFAAEGREAPLPFLTEGGDEVVATWADADWDVFSAKVEWGLAMGLDTVPVGEAMARLGRTFVGTPYVPKTLDPPGPERLVVDFRGLDCVTFVETVFSTVRFLRRDDAASLLERRGEAEDAYETLLAELRYRDGRVDGYASRLHYFSEWLSSNAAKGLVELVTPALGGERDPSPIEFMSTHPDAYRQLSDPETLEAVRAMEARLSDEPRVYVPEGRIEAVARDIRSGDIIAATSTVEGLDVAHTGLALWEGGTLRLMHAPLVGDSVQVSERSLAERIQAIPGQDGIMVARPISEPTSAGRPDEGR